MIIRRIVRCLHNLLPLLFTLVEQSFQSRFHSQHTEGSKGRLLVHHPAGQGYRKLLYTIWLADAPAVMLYAPKYLYITQDDVRGIKDGEIVNAADRFYDIHEWTVHSDLVPRM